MLMSKQKFSLWRLWCTYTSIYLRIYLCAYKVFLFGLHVYILIGRWLSLIMSLAIWLLRFVYAHVWMSLFMSIKWHVVVCLSIFVWLNVERMTQLMIENIYCLDVMTEKRRKPWIIDRSWCTLHWNDWIVTIVI